MRFAGLLRGIGRQALHYGVPQSPLEAAGRFGLDLFTSGMYASHVPEQYAHGGERALLGLEDFATQSIPGMLAAGAAGVIARRMGASPRMAGMIAGTADTAASMGVGMFAQDLGLKPFANHLDERARRDAELQAQMEREGIFQQGLNAAAERLGNTPMIQGLDYAFGGYG